MLKALFFVVGLFFCADAWVAKQSMLFPRSDFATATVGTKVYVMGGCVGDQNNVTGCPNITNVLTSYDFVTDVWTALPSAPRPRYRYMAAAVGNKIYYIGGRTLVDDIIPEVDVFDISNGTWTTLPSQNGVTSVSDGAAFVIGTKIYVSGGYSAGYDSLNTTIVLDTTASPLVFAAGLVASKPIGAGDNGAVAIGGFGYVFGGFSGSVNDWCSPLNSLERYNPTTNQWTTMASLPAGEGRGDMAYAVVGDNIFIMGGEAKIGNCVSSAVGDVERYSVSMNAWYNVSSSLAINRFRFAGAAYMNTIYDIGGQKAKDTNGIYGVLSNVYALDVSSFVSSAYTPTPTPTPNPTPTPTPRTTTSGTPLNTVCSLVLIVVALLQTLF